MEETTTINLTIGDIIGKGIKIGLKNALPLIGATILWMLTIWIPYLNVGTTIGLISAVVAMSKGSTMSATEIFDGKYRRYMGEFFLLMGIKQMGTFMGFLFFLFPGIVISISWSQSVYLLIDKKLNPMEALKVSNDITYGHKWTIFFGMFLLALVYELVLGILAFITMKISMIVCAIVILILALLFIPIIFGALAHIYGTLSKNIA